MTSARLASATLQLSAPLRAADRVHDRRTSLFLALRDGEHLGTGEVPTSSEPGPDPGASAVRAALRGRHDLAAEVPAADELLAAAPDDAGDPGSRAAAALLGAARLDLALRREGRSLAEALGVHVSDVPYAGVVGVQAAAHAAARAAALVEAGATRVRVKHVPGGGLDAVRAVLDAVDVPVVVDCNGGCDEDRDDDELTALGALPLAWLEQPFAPPAFAATARLAARVEVRIGLDESVDTLAAVARAAEVGASVLCVKPSRVGGVAAALAVGHAARAHGLVPYVGGHFEAGLGRATLAALAASWPDTPDGDVAAPSTYLVEDPCRLAPPTGGRQPLHIAPGCGPHPDAALLGAFETLD
jgi:L-alanine-DL-glutamate epimerase-like enolase superfamily enzyme